MQKQSKHFFRKIKLKFLIFSALFVSVLNVLVNTVDIHAAGLTGERYIGDSWMWTLKSNGTLVIKVKNQSPVYNGMHRDFNSKADWNWVWRQTSNSSSPDIRPYVDKVVFETNSSNGLKWGFNGFRAVGMFEGFTNVKEYSFAGLDASEAVSLENFFKDNISLESLDVWRFGAMPNIINMDGFIQGCSNLAYLRLDNLDNSSIGPTSNKHRITDSGWPGVNYSAAAMTSREDSMMTGAAEYGREIFGKGVYDVRAVFPKLTKISAKNSNIWMTKNNRGVPGAEYYDVAEDGSILYLFKTTTTFTSDNSAVVEFDSRRDYVDMISDRSYENRHTFNPPTDTLPDASTNLNILHNLNTNGAGHLAPGVYEITDTEWVEVEVAFPNTYYRIAYIGEVPYHIEGIEAAAYGEEGDDPDFILMEGENYAWLNTKTKTDWPTTGDYVIDRTDNPIKITYENAAIDINGKKHDLVITIKKVTFKNLDRIPTHAGSTRVHDSNRYIDFHPVWKHDEGNQSQWITENVGYYRTVLKASRNEGITFRNYVRVGDGNVYLGSEDDWTALSGGAGTHIDFTVEIAGANDDTTFVFHGDDLDISEKQNWLYPNDDADFDNLPPIQSVYGIGGEGFELGSGNQLDTVTFATETGLRLVDGNKVVSTGSDPNTPWSRFAVKSNATGSSYTWTSGTACTTYLLKNTPRLNLTNMEIEPVSKVLSGGELVDGQFGFVLTPDDSVENNMATETKNATNAADGMVTFGAFAFNSPIVTIDGAGYYPGTVNDATNTHGQGEHLSYTYAWTIQEVDDGDPYIKYDSEVKKLRIVVSTPENDNEMEKGIRADIYIDDKLVSTRWSNEVENNIYTADIVFNNIILKDITIRKIWDDLADNSARPDTIDGYLNYRHEVEGDVAIEISSWTDEGDDTWTFSTKIPATAVVYEWGERNVPAGYALSSTSYVGATNTYEMTNSLVPPAPDAGRNTLLGNNVTVIDSLTAVALVGVGVYLSFALCGKIRL